MDTTTQAVVSDLETAAKGLGTQILNQLKSDASSAWALAPDAGKQILERATERMGKVVLQKAGGQDVAQALADVEAQIANCTWTGAALAQAAFWTSVSHVATIVSEVVGTGLGAAASAAMGRLPLPSV